VNQESWTAIDKRAATALFERFFNLAFNSISFKNMPSKE
jgi:hypothetical protein